MFWCHIDLETLILALKIEKNMLASNSLHDNKSKNVPQRTVTFQWNSVILLK